MTHCDRSGRDNAGAVFQHFAGTSLFQNVLRRTDEILGHNGVGGSTFQLSIHVVIADVKHVMLLKMRAMFKVMLIHISSVQLLVFRTGQVTEVSWETDRSSD